MSSCSSNQIQHWQTLCEHSSRLFSHTAHSSPSIVLDDSEATEVADTSILGTLPSVQFPSYLTNLRARLCLSSRRVDLTENVKSSAFTCLQNHQQLALCLTELRPWEVRPPQHHSKTPQILQLQPPEWHLSLSRSPRHPKGQIEDQNVEIRLLL